MQQDLLGIVSAITSSVCSQCFKLRKRHRQHCRQHCLATSEPSSGQYKAVTTNMVVKLGVTAVEETTPRSPPGLMPGIATMMTVKLEATLVCAWHSARISK